MAFSAGFRNGTGFFVNSEYIVTAYHVIEDYEHICYYDIHNDTCYQVYVVDYDMETDIVLLKLYDEPVELPRVCRIAHTELPVGSKLTSYGYPEPFLDHDLTIIPMNIRVQYRYDGDYSYYRMTGTLQLGMSGGPNFTTDGRIGGMSKSISNMEQNTSNLVKSTEVVRLLRKNGVREYPNTRNVKNCVISIVNSIKVFKSAHDEWGV
jgi:S1-C subfamily serine protease